MTNPKRKPLPALFIYLLLGLLLATSVAAQRLDTEVDTGFDFREPPIEAMALGSRLAFEVGSATFERAELRISGPGVDLREEFQSGDGIAIDLEMDGYPLADGGYSWELVLVGAASEASSTRGRNATVREQILESGSFRMTGGLAVTPAPRAATPVVQEETNEGGLQTKTSADIAVMDNYIVIQPVTGGQDTGGLCVGTTCTDPNTFPTVGTTDDNSWVMLDGVQTGIRFEDSGGTAANDWEILANSPDGSGINHFTIGDVGAATTPVNVQSGAGDNSVFVSSSNTSVAARGSSRIGVGTTTPTDDVNITIQGGTSDASLAMRPTGFEWLLSAAPTSFSILDGVNDLILFDIASDAASDSFVLAPATPAGAVRVGFGTANPTATVHITGGFGVSQLLVEEQASDASVEVMFNLVCDCAPGFRMQNTTNGQIWFFRHTAAGDFSFDNVAGAGLEARLNPNGDLFLKGTVFQGSSRAIKENLDPIDSSDVLSRLAGLDLYEWSYIGTSARHVGPTAEDFTKTYGLGENEVSIAPADMAGVALAASQALYSQNEELKQRNADLEVRNAALETSVSKILARLEALEQQQD